MGTFDRSDRPQQRLQLERFQVEPWLDPRRGRRAEAAPRGRGDEAHDGIAGVADDEASGVRDRDPARPAEPRVEPGSVAKARRRSRKGPRRPVRAELDDPPTLVGHVRFAGARGRDGDRPEESSEV
jgi:hypothetical protein